MDSSSVKFYHVDDFDTRAYLDEYFTTAGDSMILEHALRNPLNHLHNEFASGDLKGDHLVDISIGAIMFPLFPIFEYFKEITILKLNDVCVNEIQKWIRSDEDAFNWDLAFKYMMELEGNSEGWQDKEEKLRKTIKSVVKCDLSKESLVDTVLVPKADCLFTAWILDTVSEDKTSYRQNLKKISSLIKPGGHLIMIADINTSWILVGGHKFHILSYDEDFFKNALKDEGYSIKFYEIVERDECTDRSDYEKVVFVIACKEREV
ncbi:hypothetical protein GDO86_000087 [Hymenochirus boettgeri]|uniref:Uncharacterized protein n=1 Tax=Hymenochirus boettgeri TaxID=247094 RepID=A0A8T2KA87_9PIPI|nr:hypothetical protein GDO86_000087 [Hymenochirus boettgeri]